MHCAVHSPCGRYFIKFLSDEKGIHILALEKSTHPQQYCDSHIAFAADLNSEEVEQLTTNAGVAKDMSLFARMIHSALTGTSHCLSFCIVTVDDVTRRIRQRQAQHNFDAADIAEVELASRDPEMRNHRVFLLEYTVDFTTAMFPIPMSQTESSGAFNATTSSSSAQVCTQNVSPSSQGVWSKALDATPPQSQVGGEEYLKLFAQKGTPGTIPKVLLTNEDVANAQVEKLQSEVKYLRQQNAALRRAGEQTLQQMQLECKELKREFGRIDVLQREVSHHREEARKAKAKCAELEAIIRRLRATTAATTTRTSSSSRVPPSPHSRPNRFATPPFRGTAPRPRQATPDRGSSRGSNMSSTPPRRVPSPSRGSWTPPYRTSNFSVRSPRQTTPTKGYSERLHYEAALHGAHQRYRPLAYVDTRTAAFR